MTSVQVLVVDDDARTRHLLGELLSSEGTPFSLAGDGRRSLALLRREPIELLFTSLCLPDMDGLALLREAFQIRPELAAVVLTRCATVDSCIEALRLGVCDYVQKPLTLPAIQAALGRAMRVCQQNRRSAIPSPASPASPIAAPCRTDQPAFPLFVHSPAMRKVWDSVAKVAPTEAPVLLRGEPGVGKELVARAIHRQSRRAEKPFIPIRCGAIQESEIELFLFGQKGPAAAGHEQFCKGLIGLAQGSTIFLSGVDRLPLWAQAQVSEVVQRGCLRSWSDFEYVPLDVRVLASTSSVLESEIAEGRFFSDLYYYLTAMVIRVPPLRERPEEIKPMAEWFLSDALARQGVSTEGQYRFTPEALESLLTHSWPGNLPELSGVVARAVALAGGKEIGREAISWAPAASDRPAAETIPVPLAGGLEEIQRRVIAQVMERCQGNKAAAARLLGLHRRTLYRMLQRDEGNP